MPLRWKLAQALLWVNVWLPLPRFARYTFVDFIDWVHGDDDADEEDD